MKDKYYIGEVEKICNIAKKTLRFYDKIGLLSPFEISNNGYRYYSKENLYTIPVIKYYKQSGFTLENIKQLMHDFNYDYIEKNFQGKIEDLEQLERELHLKKQSLADWNSLVKEAKMVIDYNLLDVKVKYLEADKYIYYDQEFDGCYISSIINIDFTNYLEEIKNAITGPVIIEFSSLKDKMDGKSQPIKILQKNLLKCNQEHLRDFGGTLALSCYHIGSHQSIKETYNKMIEWAKSHNYKIKDTCFERYIIDYWTIKDEKKFVTEVIIGIESKK